MNLSCMLKIRKYTNKKQPGISLKPTAAANDDMLRYLAFENTAQANIISSVSSGKIIIANSAACKLLGYSKKELLTKNRAAIFDITQSSFKMMLKQRTAEGKSTAVVIAINKNGKPLPCAITSAVFMNADGIEKSITSITDLRKSILKQISIDTKKERIVAGNIVLAKSKQKKIDTKKEKIVVQNIIQAQAKSEARLAEKKEQNLELEEKLEQEIAIRGKMLTEYKESFKLIFNSSSDVLYDSNLVTNKVIISDAYEKDFGYKITSNMTPAEDWVSHIHPDNKEAVFQDYLRMLASEDAEWKYSYRFLRADNSIANVFSSAIVLRNAEGKAYRMIGYMQDMSKQKGLEEKLALEIKLKEKQIAEATKEAKDTERSDIGKELHDNVTQLLGASTLYLDMAKRGGKDSEFYLSRSSEYTLTAIEEIRKLTKELTTDTIKSLGLCEAIESITRDTMEVYPVKLSCVLESFIEQSVNDKFKLNVFRIVQEQLNNILKHAKATAATINLSQNKKSITLTISDNGVGFDTGKKRKGIGVDNIKSRAAAYNGNAEFISRPGQGCVLNVTFAVTDALLNTTTNNA